MLGPDPDGENTGNFAKEDFTLLNLSQSSSTPSSSDELFAPQKHPLPLNTNKKKRLRLKRRGGYSVRQNRSSEESSQIRSRGHSPFGFGFGSYNIVYGFILLLFCWSATMSWLLFSLRNQLAESNSRLVTFESLTKDFPIELGKLSQTIQILETNITTMTTRISSLETQLSNYDKNLTETANLVKDLQSELGQQGSKANELSDKVEKVAAIVKSQQIPNEPDSPKKSSPTLQNKK